MSQSIVVDFSKPVPLFPLGSTVLLPHAVQGLHIFELRYRQMVEACLADAQGGSLLKARPIAMATMHEMVSARGKSNTALREAVCVGQIVQHQRLQDGRHTILLHGVCRATIVSIEEPDGTRLFRQARLKPMESAKHPMPPMPEARRVLKQLLQRPLVQRLASVKSVSAWVEREDVPTHAVVELVGSALIKDEALRYALLACEDPWERARMVARTIQGLEAVVAGADAQDSRSWPKGLSWN